MAVQAWSLYNKAKKNIGKGTIKLDGTVTLDMHFFSSAGNFATKTLSTLGSLTSQVASGNGYKQSGKALTGVTWTTGASAGQYRLAASAKVWTATGGAINSIKAAVLVARTGASGKDSANKLLSYASLTSAQFNVSQNNTLTINVTGGILNMA